MLEPEKKEVKWEEWGHWFCWMTNHPEVSVVAYISNLSTKEAEVKANVAIIVRICLKKLLKMWWSKPHSASVSKWSWWGCRLTRDFHSHSYPPPLPQCSVPLLSSLFPSSSSFLPSPPLPVPFLEAGWYLCHSAGGGLWIVGLNSGKIKVLKVSISQANWTTRAFYDIIQTPHNIPPMGILCFIQSQRSTRCHDDIYHLSKGAETKNMYCRVLLQVGNMS